MVGIAWQRHPPDQVARQRFTGKPGTQFPVPDPDNLLVSGIRLDGGGPALDQRNAVFGDLTGGVIEDSRHRSFGITGKPGPHTGKLLHPAHRVGLPDSFRVVDHLRALGLQDPPHDVDGGVMTVEQRGRGHEPHRMYRDVQSAPHRGTLRIAWKSDETASR